MARIKKVAVLFVTVGLSGCRTIEPNANLVQILDRPPNSCKRLGVVNVDWAWWGASTELLNVMRNQTAELGGNALFPMSDTIGTAYHCASLASEVPL